MAQDSQQLRQRRYRLHKSGIHDECKPDRECRSPKQAAPPIVESLPLSPREAMERELNRVIARLDVLHQALAERPLDVELLAELRGQARVLTSLTAALAKLGPAAPVVPLKENPLEALRRRRAEQREGQRRKFAQDNPSEPFYG
jgi:hypothetical protein